MRLDRLDFSVIKWEPDAFPGYDNSGNIEGDRDDVL